MLHLQEETCKQKVESYADGQKHKQMDWNEQLVKSQNGCLSTRMAFEEM